MLPFNDFMYERQWSFCGPIFNAKKSVPLSDQIIEGFPRLEVKRSIAITHEFVSMDGINSMLPEMVQNNRRRSSRTVVGGNPDARPEIQTSLY